MLDSLYTIGDMSIAKAKNIILTNDDGIHAAGLLELRRALSDLGNVIVVAPDRPRSGCGHSVTLHKPLRMERVRMADGKHGYASNGTPSDCVSLAVRNLAERDVSLVVSGINRGPNLGYDLTYSGTVSAAMEGAMIGAPSFAISVAVESDKEVDYTDAARFARRLAETLLDRGLPKNVLLNVNVPSVPQGQIRGVEITRQGERRYPGKIEERVDPSGRRYYWLGGDAALSVMAEGTDVKAIADDKISVTPIHLDLTAYSALDMLREWPIGEFAE